MTLRRPLYLLLSSLLSCAPGAGATLPTRDGGDGTGPRDDPGWAARTVGYEIFVRSFADSNGDGQGDLGGITARLDYLAGLGVGLLWLTPIHPSPSYHGYDVTDYLGVHPDFGTLADLSRLLDEAHRRQMRVVLDLVVNHTSAKHPWFIAAQAAQPGTPDAGRYIFRDDDPGWQWSGRPLFKPLAGPKERFFFSVFSAGLPDLNWRDPRTLPAVADIMGFWLARGADGFRLDAARYLVEWPDPASALAMTTPAVADTADTHRVWRELRRSVDAQGKAPMMIGEVWTDLTTIAAYRGAGDELTACFNFPLAGAILDGVRRGAAQPMRDTLQAMGRLQVPLGFLSPFLSNHDQQRAGAVLGGDGALLRLAAAIYLALPGTPFIYYGEEIGEAQAPVAGDRAQRAPMPWDEVAAQGQDPGSLLSHYRRLVHARTGSRALVSGRLQLAQPAAGSPDGDRLLAFTRGDQASGQVLAVYNLGDGPLAGAELALPRDYPEGPQQDLLGGGRSTAVSKANRDRYPLPTLPAHAALWLTPE